MLGDLFLFVSGRALGRPILARTPVSWLVDGERVRRASSWVSMRGPWVVLAARFLPGAPLPNHVAAGVLETSFMASAGWFVLAAAVWTPLLVGVAWWAGAQTMETAEALRRSAVLHAIVAGAPTWFALRIGVRLATYRGRRLLLSSWKRLVRWEFWPAWELYAPVAVYALYLGVRHRGITVFTAANRRHGSWKR